MAYVVFSAQNSVHEADKLLTTGSVISDDGEYRYILENVEPYVCVQWMQEHPNQFTVQLEWDWEPETS